MNTPLENPHDFNVGTYQYQIAVTLRGANEDPVYILEVSRWVPAGTKDSIFTITVNGISDHSMVVNGELITQTQEYLEKWIREHAGES